MSVNLCIAFDRYGFKNGPILCYERQRLDFQNSEAFAKIQAEAIPLPEGVQWYEDGGLEHRLTDPYGDPLTFLPAYSLARILSAFPLRGMDAASLAYLKAIPTDTRVVLWWS